MTLSEEESCSVEEAPLIVAELRALPLPFELSITGRVINLIRKILGITFFSFEKTSHQFFEFYNSYLR